MKKTYVLELLKLEDKVVPASGHLEAPIAESALVNRNIDQAKGHVMQVIDTPINEDVIVPTQGHAAENVSNELGSVEEIEGLLYRVKNNGKTMMIEFANLPEGTNLRYQLHGKEMHMAVAGYMTINADTEKPVFIQLPGKKPERLNTEEGTHGKKEEGDSEEEGKKEDTEENLEIEEEAEDVSAEIAAKSAELAARFMEIAAEAATQGIEQGRRQREFEERMWERGYYNRLEYAEEQAHLTAEYWEFFGWRHQQHGNQQHNPANPADHHGQPGHPADRSEGTIDAPRYANPDVEIPSHSSPHIVASARNKGMQKPEEDQDEVILEQDKAMDTPITKSPIARIGTFFAPAIAGFSRLFSRRKKKAA